MYCISCGKSMENVLNVCNDCGADFSVYKSGEPTEATLNLLIAASMIIPVAGLGLIVGLMSLMSKANFANWTILVAAFFCFLLLSRAELSMVRLLQKYTEAGKQNIDRSKNQILSQANLQNYFRS